MPAGYGVDVDNVDEASAGRVGLASDRAGQRGVFEACGDRERLPGLEIHADPDHELRVSASLCSPVDT